MELLTTSVEARKASGTHSSKLQRTEITSELDSDRAHVHESGGILILSGDSGREKGGTRKLRVIEEVHSTSSDT